MTDRLVPSCAWFLKAVMLFDLLESMSMYCGVKHICTVLGVRRGFDLTEYLFDGFRNFVFTSKQNLV